MKIVFTVVLFLATNLALAEIYQWKDDKGRIVFGDKPPKNKETTVKTIDVIEGSGTRFADPQAIKNFKQEARQDRPVRPERTKRIDPYCRRYLSQLNKVEIYLEHTNSPRDQQKARDLRKLIDRECVADLRTQKFSDSYCRRYREDLKKTEIFLEHTNTPRDQKKANDLRKQIALECE